MRRLLVRKSLLLATCLLLLAGTTLPLYKAFGATTSPVVADWAAPGAMAVQRVAGIPSAQHEPNFFNNLDCDATEYRLVSDAAMRTGCFTSSALGAMDSDSSTVIFTGTDEGLPMVSYGAHDILLPWPDTASLVALTPLSTGGAGVGLYKYPPRQLQDQRNYLGQLTAKQLTAPAELRLHDSNSQPLVINPSTLSFSDGGSWLVAETLYGSFVRINLASLDATAFAPSFVRPGMPGAERSQVAASRSGRYTAVNNEDGDTFKVYDLTKCHTETVNSTPTGRCDAYDFRPFLKQHIAGLTAVRHVRFMNEGLLSFEAVTSDHSGDGVYELAPATHIDALTDYLGLGDSYTSGEGAFDYLTGTDTAANQCHLSRNSYPLLLTRDFFSSAGGHSVACSGAEIHDISDSSGGYRGQVADAPSLAELEAAQSDLLNSVTSDFTPGYLPQHYFVRQYQPRVLTVSVGGDDVGFGDMILSCVEPHLSRHASDGTCFSTYEDRQELLQLINRTVPKWTSLYKRLQADAPGARIYALGYPQVFDDAGNCALNVHLNKSELEFGVEIVSYLNQSIQQAAAKAGVGYADIGQALKGHRLCETASYNVAMNGLTAGKDAGLFGVSVFGKESYHPNALGQALIEQTILSATHNLAPTVAAAPSSPDGSSLLNRPKSGRPVTVRVPVSDLTGQAAKRGTTISIRLEGTQAGSLPNTPYKLHLDGPNGPEIGTLTSDDRGTITGPVTLPASTEPGGHTIDLTGNNEAGQPIDATQPVLITDGSIDSDGDGMPDMQDSCPFAANSGQDADQDGIDDACDSASIQPPSSATEPASNPTSSTPETGDTAPNNPHPDSGSSTAPQPTRPGAADALQPATSTPATPAFEGEDNLQAATTANPLASTVSGAILTSSAPTAAAVVTAVPTRPVQTYNTQRATLGAGSPRPLTLPARRGIPLAAMGAAPQFASLPKINLLPWCALLTIPLILIILLAWLLAQRRQPKTLS